MMYRVEWRDGLGEWTEDQTFDTKDKAIKYARSEYKRMLKIHRNTPHRVVPASYEPVYTTEGDKTL